MSNVSFVELVAVIKDVKDPLTLLENLESETEAFVFNLEEDKGIVEVKEGLLYGNEDVLYNEVVGFYNNLLKFMNEMQLKYGKLNYQIVLRLDTES